jgi:hypothetical protein
MGITASPNIFGHFGPFPAQEDAMDPDFFEVVMGADGTLKFVPVTEQAHAEVTISALPPADFFLMDVISGRKERAGGFP